tara:strand:+ start:2026 stop:2661 length:636 start_codon:yes stop_codon:yes gene_type:complete
MARYGYGMSVSGTRKSIVPSSGGGGFITTSRAFNSGGGQVGSTNTGDIPESWVANEATVTSVIFANDNSVSIIGSYAFYGCTSLASINIPNSVTTISEQSFRGCTSLSSITIPDSVTSIGSYAFYDCNITTITIPSGVTSIGGYAFQSCNNLATVLCYVAQSVFVGDETFSATASPLTIRVPTSGAVSDTWTAGTGLSFQGNLNVTVIKNL